MPGPQRHRPCLWSSLSPCIWTFVQLATVCVVVLRSRPGQGKVIRFFSLFLKAVAINSRVSLLAIGAASHLGCAVACWSFRYTLLLSLMPLVPTFLPQVAIVLVAQKVDGWLATRPEASANSSFAVELQDYVQVRLQAIDSEKRRLLLSGISSSSCPVF